MSHPPTNEYRSVFLIGIKIHGLVVSQDACKNIAKSQSLLQMFMRVGMTVVVVIIVIVIVIVIVNY